MLWPLLHVCILNNFGHHRLSEEEFQAKMADGTIMDAEREAYSEPGPFSVHAYLQSLLKPGFYGDELCLLIISMIWKVRVTVLHAETLLAIKFRHMNVSMKADIILVHCSGSHYIPLGISSPFTSIISLSYPLNSFHLHSHYIDYFCIAMHLGWCILHCNGYILMDLFEFNLEYLYFSGGGGCRR